MKTVRVFDIFSLKAVTTSRGETFFKKKQRVCLHELSAGLITAGLCQNCCLNSFWRLGRAV